MIINVFNSFFGLLLYSEVVITGFLARLPVAVELFLPSLLRPKASTWRSKESSLAEALELSAHFWSGEVWGIVEVDGVMWVSALVIAVASEVHSVEWTDSSADVGASGLSTAGANDGLALVEEILGARGSEMIVGKFETCKDRAEVVAGVGKVDVGGGLVKIGVGGAAWRDLGSEGIILFGDKSVKKSNKR